MRTGAGVWTKALRPKSERAQLSLGLLAGLRCRVQGLEFRVSGVSGLGFKVSG